MHNFSAHECHLLASLLVHQHRQSSGVVCDRPWTYRKHRSERWRQIRSSKRFSVLHSVRLNHRKSIAAQSKRRRGGRFVNVNMYPSSDRVCHSSW